MLAGLVVYQIITINRMQDLNRTLSGVDFQKARTSLQAIQDRELVEEFTKKWVATGADPDFLQELERYQRIYQGNLLELKSQDPSGHEQAELKRLLQYWDAYLAEFRELQKKPLQPGFALPASLQENLDRLNSQTNSVYQASLESMFAKVERSRKTAETAVTVLWIVTVAAVAISVLVSLLIVRSISKPLAHLTEGTRAIADGKFFYRLDTTRDDEFSQLARDFNKMTSRLNELDELKKGFVSHVSHELKAPLASMRETIQLMLEEIPGPLTDKQKRLLELSLQSGTRLTSMIGNLLDLSKTEAGAMEYELKSQDLIPLVRTAIAELEVQAQERQVRIEADFPQEPLVIECDGDRIVQVVLNIIGNAVKFSPRQTVVGVRIDKTESIPESTPGHSRRLLAGSEKDGYYGLVTVSDSGPGIADADKEKVFEKFHQVKQGKKIAGQGVGLGLSICRTIIQAHRGAIWVEDNPEGGSRFIILLRRGDNSEDSSSRASKPI